VKVGCDMDKALPQLYMYIRRSIVSLDDRNHRHPWKPKKGSQERGHSELARKMWREDTRTRGHRGNHC